MSSPRARMRAPRWMVLCPALALVAAPSLVAAQPRIEFVSRAGGSTGIAGPIALRDCPTERWTFRLTLDGSVTGTPDLWLSRGDTCTHPLGDADCLQAHASAPARVTAQCDGATCWEFSVESRWLVDPATGICSVATGGATRVFAWVGSVGVASPRVVWDTLVPAAPSTVSANYGSESQVNVTWGYSVAVDAGTDADADVIDVGDADVIDVVDAGVDVVSDIGSDVAPDSVNEPVRRFWVLCDPVDLTGLDASVACASGGFDGLRVESDQSVLHFALQCNEPDGGVASTATAVTLTHLPLGQPYRFAVVAEDLAGNRSAPAYATVCSSAETYTDFWEHYRATGGYAQPGCAVAPTPAWRPGLTAALLVAFGAVLRRRRRRP